MNTQNRINKRLTLVVMLCVSAAFVGLLQASLVVEEHFDYTPGTILSGSGGTGFDGAWSTTGNDASTILFTIRDGGLTFMDGGGLFLDVTGNSVYRPDHTGRTEANRALSASSQGVLCADGSTIWFSVLYKKTAGSGNYFGFVIGTDTFDVASTGALDGYATGGEGFGVGSNYGDQVEAISYDDTSGMTTVNSGLVADPVRLIAGKIVWSANGTDDVMYLYNVTDLLTEPTTPIATITADLDQSNFDSVAMMHNVSNALFDEIHIGTTYSDVVVPLDPDLPTVDAGGDVITWSGQEVQLAPDVVNNDSTIPQRTLTYLWSADPVDGVVFDPPTADVEAPTVTITKATLNPSPVKLTLAVSLSDPEPGEEDSVLDIMTIDVYDDACLVTIAADLPLDPGDVNTDCVTNFEDIAEMAADWVHDYSLTEPAPKP